MVGLKRGEVRLAPYNPKWEKLFAVEDAALRASVGEYAIDIQHVGSTAIPGMVTKPIIDIGIAVRDFEEARACVGPIEQLGYQYRGENGIPRRHFFVKGEPRTHHLHMVEESSGNWRAMLRFRDYLIEHPEIAQEYADLKTRLALRFQTDRQAYRDGKSPFIECILKAAGVPSNE